MESKKNVKVWGTFPKVKPHTISEQQSFEIKKENSQDWSIFTGQNKYKRIFGLWKLRVSSRNADFHHLLE
jgi:hypothetical protein